VIKIKKISRSNFGLFSFAFFLTLLQLRYKIGDQRLRMALSSSDDNPFNNVQPILHRSAYQFDALMRSNAKFAILSFLTVLTLFCLKIGISSYFLWNIFVIGQILLLLLASKTLMETLHQKSYSVIGFWFFILACKPYYLNLAGMSALDDQVYAFWIATPFTLYAIAMMLRKHYHRMSLAAIFAFCIHPTTGLLLAGYLLMNSVILDRRHLKKVSKLLFLVPAAALGIYITNKENNVKVPEFILAQLKENFHLTFFEPSISQSPRFCIYVWLLVISIMIAVNFYAADAISNYVKKSYNVLFCFMMLLTGIQYIAVQHGVVSLMSLVPARISVVYIIFGLIIIFTKVFSDIEKGVTLSFINLILIVYPSPWIIACLGVEGLLRKTRLLPFVTILRFFFAVAGLITITGFNFLHVYAEQSFWGKYLLDLTQFDIAATIRSSFSIHPLLLLTVFTFSTIFLINNLGKMIPGNKKMGIMINVLMSSVLFLIVIIQGFIYQRQFTYENNIFTEQKVIDLAAAQEWSQINTPTASNFIVTPNGTFTPWRTLSERPVIQYGYVDGLYGYDSESNKYTLSIRKFWDESGSHELNKNNLCSFTKKFGGQYLVENSGSKLISSPSLERVYRNQNYIISKILC
jgi:hypothetical protein